VAEIFPKETDFFTYYDPRSPQSILEAQNDLLEMLSEESEGFDGVLAFSEGAALVSSVILRFDRDNPFSLRGLFRFAIFIAGVAPFDQSHVERAAGEVQDGGKSLDMPPRVIPGPDTIMHLPTLHVMGKNDMYYPSSMVLSQVCVSYGRTVIVHEGGHEVPRSPRALVTKIKDAIETLIEKTNVGQ
jgi:hypothetical protein